MRSAEITVDSTGQELEKILVELPPDYWSGSGGERVWTLSLADDHYEIRNTPWYTILEQLNGLGAMYENADDQLFSLDLEPRVDPAPILDRLAVEEEQGRLLWETGWS